MFLREVLAPERVVVPLRGRSLAEAASALLERLAPAHGVLDLDRLRRRVAEERAEDVVAMGDRAFLLHYRTTAVGQLLVALGVAEQPLCRRLGDDEEQCARIVLLIAAPPRLAARYLQVVGAFARILRTPEGLAEMLAAPDAAALIGLPSLASAELAEELTVRDVMSDHPRTVRAELSLRDAARLLARTGLGALPVVNEEHRVIGMVSEREVIRHLLATRAFTGGGRGGAGPVSSPRTVGDIMTSRVMCVAPQQPIAEVAALMTNKDVERVPVVRDGRLVGFLTRGDIVRKLIGR